MKFGVRVLVLPAKVLFTLVLIVALVRHVDVSQLVATIGSLSFKSLAWASALLLLQGVLIAWRWHWLLSLLGQRLPFLLALRWVFVGLFFNQALPASVGGDVLRVWYVHRHGAAPGVALASVLLDRLTGVALLGLLVSAALPDVWAVLPQGTRLALALTGPVLLAMLAILACADRLPDRWVPAGLRPSLAVATSGLRRLARSPADCMAFICLGVAAAVCGLSAAWVLGNDLGMGQSLWAVIVVLGGAILVSALPISLGGWGVREASVVAMFSAMGVAPERALAMSVTWGALMALTAVPGGLLWWLNGRRDAPAQLDVGAPPAS